MKLGRLQESSVRSMPRVRQSAAAALWCKLANLCAIVFFVASLLTTGAARTNAQIALMQRGSLDAGSTGSGTLAFPSNNTAGNWIAVCIRAGAMNEAFSITDSLGNTYRKAIQLNQTGDGDAVAIFYAENIAAGVNTVTVSETIPATLRFAIMEYSGIATSGSLDVTAAAQGNSASPNSGNAVTTANGDLLLGVIMTSDAGAYTAGSGYKIEGNIPAEPNTKLIAEDQIQGSAGTVSASVLLGATDMWAAGLAAFKAASKAAGSGGVSLMQRASLDARSTGSGTLAFPSNNTAGNWIAVCIRAGAMNEAFSITDSLGNTYRKAIQLNQTGDGDAVAIFYAENIAAGVNTVTVSETIPATLRFAIMEYSGIATSGSLDVTAAAQGNSASPNSGNAVTTANGDLLLGVIMTSDAGAYTAGSGYKIEGNIPAEPNTKLIAEDQIQGSAGTVSASVLLGATDMWAAGLAAFKAAGGGAGTGPSANVSASPTSAVFTNVPVGTTNTQTIQLKNTASSSAVISALATQGAGFGTSGLTMPLTLVSGATSTFNVTFSPTTAGTVGGMLTLSSNGAGSPVVIPLVGSAIAATQLLAASPTSVAFGNVAVGALTTSNVTLANIGNSSVTVQSIGATGAGFSASSGSTATAIAPGQSAALAIQFAPTNLGSVTGAIAISTGPPNATTVTISVTGTGVAPSGHVILSWVASPSAGVVGYNVYRSTVSGGPYAKLVSSPVSGTSYSDQTVQSGVQYYYVVTSVTADQLESTYSVQTAVSVP